MTHRSKSGTHQGEFLGIVPTGRRIKVQVIEMARVADGKIGEHWAEMDMLGMLKQLALMPEPIGTPGRRVHMLVTVNLSVIPRAPLEAVADPVR